ncbi:MAG: hypothetical protein IJA34_17435 [Lachnospiraceae bacterium]|nr:hypothetical protein [Lachnospiraceae bacterium]
MPNYYMNFTNEIDYEWDSDNQFSCAGFPERNKKSLQQMEISDKIIYCVTKQSKFMAAVEVVGEYFYSEKPIWDDLYELWPHRIHTKPITYIDDFAEGVYIKDIWDGLEFIKNKVKWESQVQGSFRCLSEHDYNVIYQRIREQRA